METNFTKSHRADRWVGTVDDLAAIFEKAVEAVDGLGIERHEYARGPRVSVRFADEEYEFRPVGEFARHGWTAEQLNRAREIHFLDLRETMSTSIYIEPEGALLTTGLRATAKGEVSVQVAASIEEIKTKIIPGESRLPWLARSSHVLLGISQGFLFNMMVAVAIGVFADSTYALWVGVGFGVVGLMGLLVYFLTKDTGLRVEFIESGHLPKWDSAKSKLWQAFTGPVALLAVGLAVEYLLLK